MRYQCLIIIISLLITSINLTAQSLKITGTIINEENKEAVPFATIQIKGQMKGTVANMFGNFELNIQKTDKQVSVVISSLGFENKTIIISEFENTNAIALIPREYEIAEILVKPKNPLDIIGSALSKVEKNYSQLPVYLDGFYRELLSENNQYIELAEAACKFYYAAYEKYDVTKSVTEYFKVEKVPDLIKDYTFDFQRFNLITHDKDQVKILESRSTDYLHNEHFKVVVTGGPLNIMACDAVKNVSDSEHQFLNPNFFKYYQYELIDITTYNDKRVYVIKFKPGNLKKAWWKGTLYVDIESEAFITIEYEVEPQSKIKREVFAFIYNPALFTNKNSKCKNYFELKNQKVKVDYRQIGNEWSLSHIKRERIKSLNFSEYYVHYKMQPKIDYYESTELIINNIEEKNVVPFNTKETLKNSYSTVLQEYQTDYNEEFWENYNILKSTPLEDSIKQMLEQKKLLKTQFKEKRVRDDSIQPPIAKIRPDTLFIHNDTLVDSYKWIENINDENVLSYINDENKYTDNYLKPLKEFQKNLFDEMKKRADFNLKRIIKKRKGGYNYFYDAAGSKSYPDIIKENISTGEKSVVLESRGRSNNSPNYAIGGMVFSPSGKFFVFYEQKSADYDIQAYIFDIKKNLITDSIKNAYPVEWLNNETLIYTSWNSTNRVNKVCSHSLHSAVSDKLIFKEDDLEKEVDFINFKSLILVESYGKLSADYYMIKKTDLDEPLKFMFSIDGHLSGVYEKNGQLYIGKGDSLFVASLTNYQPENWQYFGLREPDVLQEIETTNFVVKIRRDKLKKYFVIYSRADSSVFQTINFKGVDYNHLELMPDSAEENNDCFLYKFSTLSQPDKYLKYNITKKTESLIWQDSISGYDSKKYKQEVLWVKTKDSKEVPLSIFYKKGRKRNGEAGVYLTSYGTGNHREKAQLDYSLLPLIDRGLIYAYAHVRGEGILGYDWFIDGTGMNRANAVNDFVVCADYLIENKYTKPGKIVVEGSSSGGFLVTAAMVKKPGLYNTVIANVPLIDIITNTIDSLGVFSGLQRKEYGNPNDKVQFEYMKSYVPYENIKESKYPNVLFVTGLNDERVKYWHSLKTIAKLRGANKSDNTILLKTGLFSGHGGIGGWSKYGDIAYKSIVYAFLLDNLGITK